jgi:putative ABC transport system permease protein
VTPRRSLPARIYGALLRLLPREFRGDYGEQMQADLEERQADPAATALVRREIVPLGAAVVREHAGILRRDVRDAVRMMRRTPGFTALAVLMLAIGTGANVAMFTVIDAVMLRSPFAAPDRIVVVQTGGEGKWSSAVPAAQFEAMQASPRTLSAIAALDGGEHILTGRGDPRRIDIECVTPSMFDVTGTPPRAGRAFGPADDRPGAPPVIVLSDAFARELGDPAALVGEAITLNGRPVTVVGVMPRGFSGLYSRSDVSGWLPISLSLAGSGLTGCRRGPIVNAFARVRDGVTLTAAAAAFPGVQLLPIDDTTFGELRTPFLILTVAVACVLLIACLNVGGLQLERSLARQREMALRTALGASRARLVRHGLTENLVLALTGAVAGVATTYVSLGALVSILPANLPYLAEIAVNGRALAAALAAAVAAGLVAGLGPVLQTRQIRPVGALATSSRTVTARRDWTRRTFVIVEIALSIVVLIAAGLMIRTFATLRPSRPGFEAERKLMTLVRLPGATPLESEQFFARLFERLHSLPGVRGVAGSSYLPMSGVTASVSVALDGVPPVSASSASTTPGYFDLLRIPVTRGRAFTERDTPASPLVAIVNEALAARLDASGAVVGRTVRASRPRVPGSKPIEWQIVGVIANTRSFANDTRARAEFYVPFAQNPVTVLYAFVDTDRWREPAAATEIRGAIRAIDPDLVIEPVDSLTAFLDRRVSRPRFGAWLLGVFAALAVILAAAGLMTTMGWWVRQRTRELSIRVALGASRSAVTRLVLRQGLAVAIAGIAAGCLAAAWLTRYLQGWIYGVTPLDAATFGAAAGILALVAAGAIYVPLRRALGVNPASALSAE